LGPIVGGAIKDISGSYYTAIIIGSLVCVTGIAVYGLLMPHKIHVNTKIQANKDASLAVSTTEARSGQ
jgi:hypothetical protein